MNPKQSISYPAQFALLLALTGVFMILGSFLTLTLASNLLRAPLVAIPDLLNRAENADTARLLNTFISLLVFFFPSLIFAWIVSRKPFNYLGFRSPMSLKQLLLVLFLAAAAMTVSGSLGELNQHIRLPEPWLTKARALEDAYKATMLAMASMKNFNDYLLVLLIMAIAPAIFEEVLFRGTLQQVLIGWTRNAWAGIIITSILFSAIHFSFFGFLPRIALGIILGRIFYDTRNLWLNILLHFLNNAFVVTQLYIVGMRGKSIEKAIDENTPVWWGIFGLAGLLILFKLLRRESSRVSTTQFHSETDENIIS